jgi:hypothetical protein
VFNISGSLWFVLSFVIVDVRKSEKCWQVVLAVPSMSKRNSLLRHTNSWKCKMLPQEVICIRIYKNLNKSLIAAIILSK